jgi:hypothetical protein
MITGKFFRLFGYAMLFVVAICATEANASMDPQVCEMTHTLFAWCHQTGKDKNDCQQAKRRIKEKTSAEFADMCFRLCKAGYEGQGSFPSFAEYKQGVCD